jgi:hypothetical protein
MPYMPLGCKFHIQYLVAKAMELGMVLDKDLEAGGRVNQHGKSTMGQDGWYVDRGTIFSIVLLSHS